MKPVLFGFPFVKICPQYIQHSVYYNYNCSYLINLFISISLNIDLIRDGVSIESALMKQMSRGLPCWRIWKCRMLCLAV